MDKVIDEWDCNTLNALAGLLRGKGNYRRAETLTHIQGKMVSTIEKMNNIREETLNEAIQKIEAYCNSCYGECFDCQIGSAIEILEEMKGQK